MEGEDGVVSNTEIVVSTYQADWSFFGEIRASSHSLLARRRLKPTTAIRTSALKSGTSGNHPLFSPSE